MHLAQDTHAQVQAPSSFQHSWPVGCCAFHTLRRSSLVYFLASDWNESDTALGTCVVVLRQCSRASAQRASAVCEGEEGPW